MGMSGRDYSPHCCVVLAYYVILAPSGPPTEFMITSSNDNPTQLVLSWKAPAPEDQNGIITEYRYKCSNNPDQVNMTSGDITTVTVKGLAVFTNYTCDVRAATVVGVGPAVSQDAITGEDGMVYSLVSYFSCVISLMLFSSRSSH